MMAVPLTLEQANTLIGRWHRHHQPVTGHRFSIGVIDHKELVGAAVVGRPVARKTGQYLTAEVTRLVTVGRANTCSFLYSRCARVAREMGYDRIQTFILEEETGTSLVASGWVFDGWTDTRPNLWLSREGRRSDQPSHRKQRWIKQFREGAPVSMEWSGLASGDPAERPLPLLDVFGEATHA